MSTMRSMMNKRVVFSPDENYYDSPPAKSMYNQKQFSYGTSTGGGAKLIGGCNKKRGTILMITSTGAANLRNIVNPKSNPSSSAVRFLRRVGAEVARALRLVSSGRKWSRKVSSASTPGGLPRSWSYAESTTLDSQRAEAIEDCIEFLNSSSASSLQRSYSAASCSSNS